jgi:hypothetical protein
MPDAESFIVFFGGLIENSNLAKKHAEFSYYIIQSTLTAFLFEDRNAHYQICHLLRGNAVRKSDEFSLLLFLKKRTLNLQWIDSSFALLSGTSLRFW